MPPLSATQTVDRARAALQSGKGAGLPELLKLLETLTTNHAEVSLDQLSELIEKDAAVLSRVLSMANTVAHNPGFTPLSSVTHAIHQIGFTRVRNLALSLMLVENAGPRNAPEQREAAAHALTAGLLAQGCAQSLGSVDPDLAFACAALRQFGNIILPAVSLDHYREVQDRLKTKPEDIAYRGMFGVTPLELSRKLLAASRLPEEITRTLRDCKPEAIGGVAASTYDSRLLGVADFGSQLAKITLDGTQSADAFAERSRALARRYEKIVPGAKDAIEPALLHTDDRIATFTQNNGGASLPTVSLRRIRDRVHGQAPGTSSYAPGETPAAKPEGAPADGQTIPVPTESTTPDTAAIENISPTPAVAEVASTATGAAPLPPVELKARAESAPPEPVELAASSVLPASADPTSAASAAPAPSVPAEAAPIAPPAPAAPDPWLAALQFVHHSFGAQECWLFLPQAGGESLPLTQGIGPYWPAFKTCAALRRDERTVFGVCLTRRENVLIHDTTAANLVQYLPDWYRSTEGAPGAFMLIPLHDEKKTHGLVLIGWKKPHRIDVTPAQTELARQMFASVGKSLRAK